ncbi:MAG: hypothetical protein KA508_00790 [Gammaproteobacteria bacterium]|nr:hypothetical protein [Gammaproteobacteria bacterium]
MKEDNHLKWFRSAYRKIPAYKHYVDKHGVTVHAFQDIPIKDKNSYILAYSLKELFPNGTIPAIGHSSSGSSGEPTLWFRGKKQSKIGRDIYKKIFSDIFGIKKDEPTLVLICFAMGMWVAGTYTFIACEEISKCGYKITTFTTGMDTQAICSILKQSASSFKNVVLIGYPFFLDVVFEEISKQSCPIINNFFIITSGDKFSEKWRTDTLNKISKSIAQSSSVINVYGSSDAGILGYETPLSIFIRQAAIQNGTLYKKIFGDSDPSVMPTLVQHEPENIFFEEKNGELILTTDLDCPLIRYNIHDRGRVFSFSEMREILHASGVEDLPSNMTQDMFALPFLMVDTRTDVSITFNAVKIYPEQIKASIIDPRIAAFFSGSFRAYMQKDCMNKNRIHLELELAQDGKSIKITQILEKEISDCIMEHLKKSNSEYRAIHASCPDDTVPVLSFHLYGSSPFVGTTKDGAESVLISLAGKKPKVLTATKQIPSLNNEKNLRKTEVC